MYVGAVGCAFVPVCGHVHVLVAVKLCGIVPGFMPMMGWLCVSM